MRKNFFTTIFIVIGIFTVFCSLAVAFSILCKKLTINFAESDFFSDDFSFEEDDTCEPIIISNEENSNI